jgi:hypothetical protein
MGMKDRRGQQSVDGVTATLRISFACLILLALFGGIGRCAVAQQMGAIPAQAFRPGVLWLLDLGLDQDYEDNLFGAAQSGYFTDFTSRLDFSEQREHGFWSLNFQPTVQRFYNLAVGDRLDEQVSTNDSWQISRRWKLNLDGDYLHTSDPFERSEGATGAQPVTSAVVVAPNSSFVGTTTPFITFSGTSTLYYQVGRYSELTLGGDYFSSRENISGLPNTSSQSLRVGYTKMVRRGQTIGLLYSDQFFDVINPEEQVTTHSLLLTYDFSWKTGREISLFAGPQYSLLSGNSSLLSGPSPTLAVFNQDILGYAAGATLSIVITKQNYLQFIASRRIADGAGVSGAEIQDQGRLGFSRRFDKRVSASIATFYSDYQALGSLPVVVTNSWGASANADFSLSPRSRISVEYDYFHQPEFSPTLAPLFSHNRALIGYHYSFGSLPGR